MDTSKGGTKNRGADHSYNKRKLKNMSNKLVAKIIPSPRKPKQKMTRAQRQFLNRRDLTPITTHTPTLRIGSMNINGLDMETSWASQQLVTKHSLDVWYFYISRF